MVSSRLVRLSAIVGILVCGGAAAQEAGKAPEPYTPGLGDFMTAYVQPHHVKLWLAGRAGNWKLAQYEAKELEETFEDVANYQAIWNDLPIGKMVESAVTKPLDAVEDAIKAKSAQRFQVAYRDLTRLHQLPPGDAQRIPGDHRAERRHRLPRPEILAEVT